MKLTLEQIRAEMQKPEQFTKPLLCNWNHIPPFTQPESESQDFGLGAKVGPEKETEY